MLKEFREFALQGNMLDLAIGVAIGAAFGKIVESFTTHIFAPVLALAGGGKSQFGEIKIPLGTGDDAPAIMIGSFIDTFIQFLIVAFVLFMIVKAVNRFKKQAPPAGPSSTDALLMEIRDELKAKS